MRDGKGAAVSGRMHGRGARVKLIMVLNTPARADGNVREWALMLWAQRRGAEIWTIQDADYLSKRVRRLLALPLLLARMWKRPRSIVLLGYPAFPFFWSLESTGQLLRSLAFIVGCKIVGVLRRQHVIIDIMDLIRYQHVDLHYEVRLPKWLFRLFDCFVYHLASELWVCSSGIADQIRKEMRWGRGRVRTVENGTFPSEFDVSGTSDAHTPRIFMYAGQCYRTRGIDQLIDEFRKCGRADVELRFCGGGGEWIEEYASDPRVSYLGRLSHDACAKAVSEIDVGVVFQPQGFYYDMVFPTKLPLYIGRGKPVIATDNPELARAVQAKGVGLVVSRDEIASAIDSMTAERMLPYAARCRELRDGAYWNSIYDQALSNALRSTGGANSGW